MEETHTRPSKRKAHEEKSEQICMLGSPDHLYLLRELTVVVSKRIAVTVSAYLSDGDRGARALPPRISKAPIRRCPKLFLAVRPLP